MDYPNYTTRWTQSRLQPYIQYRPFPQGGFCAHRIVVPEKKGHFSAYYNPNNVLVDAEQKVNSSVRSVKKGGPIWSWLHSFGGSRCIFWSIDEDTYLMTSQGLVYLGIGKQPSDGQIGVNGKDTSGMSDGIVEKLIGRCQHKDNRWTSVYRDENSKYSHIGTEDYQTIFEAARAIYDHYMQQTTNKAEV